MNPNKPKFWITIAALYLVVLCVIIAIYNIDFLGINCLLFLPLYAPLVVAIILTNSGEQDDSNKPWTIKWALLAATAIVVVFKIMMDKIR